jgi:hypothetical protein
VKEDLLENKDRLASEVNLVLKALEDNKELMVHQGQLEQLDNQVRLDPVDLLGHKERPGQEERQACLEVLGRLEDKVNVDNAGLLVVLVKLVKLGLQAYLENRVDEDQMDSPDLLGKEVNVDPLDHQALPALQVKGEK